MIPTFFVSAIANWNDRSLKTTESGILRETFYWLFRFLAMTKTAIEIFETTEHTELTESLLPDPLTGKVIGCAIEVHKYLGPGLLESTYKQCLAHELTLAGVPFQMEAPVTIYYKGVTLDCGYRADFIVDDLLIVELKSVEVITPIHQAQLLAYMKLAEAATGLLINFKVKLLKDGIKRFKI